VLAAVLTELNKPLQLRQVETTELTSGQVRVRVIVSGICGSQLHEISGAKGNARFLPHLLGHEGCGVVEDLGPGVSELSIGDKVVMHWRPGRGMESDFPKYTMNKHVFTSGKVNTFTEYAVVSENRLTKVPQDTNPELAALLGCSMTTALGLIENESNLKFGESVLVLGCGGVGLNVISASRLRGAGLIVGYDSQNSKKTIVLKQGADQFYSSKSEIAQEFDVIVDTTGNVELIGWSFDHLSGQGRLILVGQPKPDESLVFPNALRFFNGSGLKVRATQGGGFTPTSDIPRYLKLFDAKHLSIDNLITHRFTLEKINEAFDTLVTGEAGRIMIQIGEDIK
jgi:S-(hydroxymethyl)glutathione dehydrogenase / alcohol dehydrogenase